MTDLKTAAQQVLEALEQLVVERSHEAMDAGDDALAALRAALEQPEQEPVASIYITPNGAREFDDWRHDLPVGSNLLYTAPPQRPAEPEQEPVAWMGTSGVGETIVCKKRIFSFMSTPLYTHPKRRSWQGLTQGEHEKARHVCRHVGVEGLVLWLEDKLKERNA